MLKEYKADLHIHTCLSPCADLHMSPSAIIRTASEKGLNMIAITDHNSAENVDAAIKAAENTGISVLAGMEISSVEEAHILALFDDMKSAIRLQEIIYENLQPGENNEEQFGEQIVVNEKEEVLSFNKRLLIGATELSAQSIVNTIRSFGGLSIASHVDREAFGIISQLGFIPDDLKFDALEMSPGIQKQAAEDRFRDYIFLPWVSSSDSHSLENIGKRTMRFLIKEPTVTEIKYALRNTDGRKAEWG